MQDKKYDLLSLGELLLRLSPPTNERICKTKLFEQNIGGAEFNVVAGVSNLGLKTGFISKIPSNDIGSLIENEIFCQNISNEFIIKDNSKDSRIGIYFYENGAYPRKPRIVYDRKYSSINNICIDDFPEEMYTSTKCFHTCGITLGLNEKIRKIAIEIIKRFKKGGALISFDVNFRSNLWTGEEAKKYIEEILPLVDIFFCSESTARLTFLKNGTEKEIMKSFTDKYPISIIATTKRIVHSPKSHSFGSIIYDAKNNKYFEEKMYKEIEVIDRIGSGDAYISGVLYGILTNPKDLSYALSLGNAISALKNTIKGDIVKTNIEEINSIIKEHKYLNTGLEMTR